MHGSHSMSLLLDDSSVASPTSEREALIREGTDLSSVARATSRSSKLRCAVGAVILVSAVVIATAIHACVSRGLLRNEGLRKETSKEAEGFVEESDEEAEELEKDLCPGCDDSNYRCVVAMDGSFSQCIDCSPAGNWKNDCPVLPELLRKAAVETCGLACGDMLPPKDSRPAIEPYCHMGSMEPAYSHERCEKMEDHSLRVSCESKDPNKCGVELSSHWGTGGGMYTVSMQAGRGAGLSTRFYLYTYGLGKDRGKPWNEITFEVLGKTCTSSETQIVTDFTAGPYDAGADYWAREKSHQEFIKVPFDACEDWHTYTLDIENGSIAWMVDDAVYRQDDISGYDDLIVALYQRELQARLALVGQDETAGGWEEMGYLSQNEFPFPTYAWFANIEIPTYEDVDSGQAEPNSSDPSASEDADGTADDGVAAASEGTGGHRSKAAALKHKQTSRSEGAGNETTDDSDNRRSKAATSKHRKVSRPDDAGNTAADDDDDDDGGGDDDDDDDDDDDEGDGSLKRGDSDHDRSGAAASKHTGEGAEGTAADGDGDSDGDRKQEASDRGRSSDSSLRHPRASRSDGAGGTAADDTGHARNSKDEGDDDDDLKEEESDLVRSGATASRTSRSDGAGGTAGYDAERTRASRSDDAGGAAADDAGTAAADSEHHGPDTATLKSVEASQPDETGGTTSDGIDLTAGSSRSHTATSNSAKASISEDAGGASTTEIDAPTEDSIADTDNRETPDDIGSLAGPADTNSDDDDVDVAGIADSIRDIAAQLEAGDVHSFGGNTHGPPQGG